MFRKSYAEKLQYVFDGDYDLIGDSGRNKITKYVNLEQSKKKLNMLMGQ